jgi:hypothetical protein
MICIGNFQKDICFRSKGPNFIVLLVTYVSESPVLFYGDFFMNLYGFDSDEATKLRFLVSIFKNR